MSCPLCHGKSWMFAWEHPREINYEAPAERSIQNYRHYGWIDEMRQHIAELEFEIEELNEAEL
jgi:hypothetical protein